MGQTVFWGFHIAGRSNLISVLMSDLTVSLKWLTVTLKIERAYRLGTNCFLGVSDGAELEFSVGLGGGCDACLDMGSSYLKN